MAIIMTLWIGRWQLKEFSKQIIHGRNFLIFKILLIAFDWNG